MLHWLKKKITIFLLEYGDNHISFENKAPLICPRAHFIFPLWSFPRLSHHSEASEEGEEGQEETPRSSGVWIQKERAGRADPEAALALWQHALTQRSDTPQWDSVAVHDYLSVEFRGTNKEKKSNAGILPEEKW